MTPVDIRSRVATFTEAASILGFSVPVVRRLVNGDELRTVTIGSTRRYIPHAALEEFAKKVTE